MNAIAALIGAFGIAGLLLGVGVFRRQRKAASCPLHRHWVGAVAMMLGWTSVAAGLALIGYALMLLGT